MVGGSIFERRHFEQRLAKNADQSEMAAILSGATALDAGFYDEEVSGALDDFEQPEDEAAALDWHRRDIAKENGVGKIHEEVARRVGLMGTSYPFDIENNTLKYRQSPSGVYEFCLAASLQTDKSSLPFAYIVRAFEKISALISAEFIGPPADVFHTGAPRLGTIPNRFDDAIKAIERATGEWRWNPDDIYPEEYASSGDEGLDFIIRKQADKFRRGQMFLIGQCACGEDWLDKWHDLTMEKLGKWVRAPLVPPVRIFATPFVLSHGNIDDAQREAGMVFDRARLTLVSSGLGMESEFAAWVPELKKLAELVLRHSSTPVPAYTAPFELAARTLAA